MYGYGYSNFLIKSNGFAFTNTDAEAYYDALVIANSGVEDIQDLYGISLVAFKMAINNAFVSLEDAGVLSKIKRWTPRIGDISATQVINAKNPALYEGLFAAGSTFSSAGVTFNGTTGKENTGFLVNNFSGVNNIGISFKYVSGTLSDYAQIVADSANPVLLFIYKDPLGRFLGYINTANYSGHTVEAGGFYTYNRTTISELYVNGINEDSVAVMDALSLSNSQLCIGGGNVNLAYANATLRNEIFHDALDATETEALYTALNNFDTALGR